MHQPVLEPEVPVVGIAGWRPAIVPRQTKLRRVSAAERRRGNMPLADSCLAGRLVWRSGLVVADRRVTVQDDLHALGRLDDRDLDRLRRDRHVDDPQAGADVRHEGVTVGDRDVLGVERRRGGAGRAAPPG